MVELDVYNIEGQLLVHHDDTVDRTTNGKGPISSHSFEALRSLDAGNGQQIPTLKEVVTLVSEKTAINIELKGPETALPVATFIKNDNSSTNYLISSFDYAQLKDFHQASPTTPIAILSHTFTPNLLTLAHSLSASAINLPTPIITPEIVETCHQQNLKVFAFTANDPQIISQMLTLKVDALFTDYPDRLIKALPRSI